MKAIIRLFFVCVILLYRLPGFGQATYSISGTVTDDKGTPMPSATVFLSGTIRITASDLQGKFKFEALSPGTYQLSVSMLGFEPYAQATVVKDGPVTANVTLKVKTTDLREVVINPNERARNFALFKRAFLGITSNAKSCTILNPEVLSFFNDRKKRVMTAEATDFLVIENKRLGYRIKYLLKDFNYDFDTNVVLYDGETSFEELPGKASDKRKWTKERAETYKNSMMHFLRSVYTGEPLKEGFIAYNIAMGAAKPGSHIPSVIADPLPADFNYLVGRADTSFVIFRFRTLYVMYDPSKANKLLRNKTTEVKLDDKGTGIKLIAKEAVIDRRGSYADYKTFYISGGMADKRVGDQLPFEYQPDK